MRYGLLMRIGAVVFAIGTLPSAYAQTAAGSTRPWTPAAWRMGSPTSRACGTTKSRTSHLSSFPKSSPGDRRLRRRNCRPAQKRSPKQNRRRRLDRAGRCRVLCPVLVRLVLAQAAGGRLARASRGSAHRPDAAADARGAQDGRLHARTPARCGGNHGSGRPMRVTRRAGDDDADRLQQRQSSSCRRPATSSSTAR